MEVRAFADKRTSFAFSVFLLFAANTSDLPDEFLTAFGDASDRHVAFARLSSAFTNGDSCSEDDNGKIQIACDRTTGLKDIYVVVE